MRVKYIDFVLSCTNSGKVNVNPALHENLSFYGKRKFVPESHVEKQSSWNFTVLKDINKQSYNEQSWQQR